ETVVGWGQDRLLSEADKMAKPFEELAKDRFIIGTPDDLVSELRRYADIGVTYALLRFNWPGMPLDAVLRAIRLAGQARRSARL
ncbi:MAG: hypothetical protein HY329_27595, partial [Chloroflexi bacterium]|nr:hypothetical protein [Chloroflexota bacterium]